MRKKKKEEDKELMGINVVEMAVLRKSQRNSDEDSENDGDGSGTGDGGDGSGSGRKKNCERAKVERIDLTSGLSQFADKLKKAGMAGIRLDGDVLEFEKHKHEVEIAEREKGRIERRQERMSKMSSELITAGNLAVKKTLFFTPQEPLMPFM